jgi:hypothetical protein
MGRNYAFGPGCSRAPEEGNDGFVKAFTQFRDQFLKFNKIFFRDQKKKRGFDY